MHIPTCHSEDGNGGRRSSVHSVRSLGDVELDMEIEEEEQVVKTRIYEWMGVRKL